jgi:hypothetical protein
MRASCPRRSRTSCAPRRRTTTTTRRARTQQRACDGARRPALTPQSAHCHAGAAGCAAGRVAPVAGPAARHRGARRGAQRAAAAAARGAAQGADLPAPVRLPCQVSLLSSVLFYAVTTGAGVPTLGEEYTDLHAVRVLLRARAAAAGRFGRRAEHANPRPRWVRALRWRARRSGRCPCRAARCWLRCRRWCRTGWSVSGAARGAGTKHGWAQADEAHCRCRAGGAR